jgi:hypothetical protein
MPENERTQGQDSKTSGQDANQNQSGQGSQQNTSSQQQEDNNPQQGTEWSNYRTREMSSNAEETGGGEGNASTPGNE